MMNMSGDGNGGRRGRTYFQPMASRAHGLTNWLKAKVRDTTQFFDMCQSLNDGATDGNDSPSQRIL